jgi:CheY-like chemotaxis protein
VPGKRALIVDDSKSARVVLSRMLETYEMEVDTANSAEDALAYLKGQRPDVIFMDHLMPGMDGFQAVQVIKNDPRTASIPICMYTSQEGELYVGQARALGAVGVLPKQIAPTDVSKVLYQLHLLPERRDERPSTLAPLAPPATVTAVRVPAPAPAGPVTAAPAPVASPEVPPAERRAPSGSELRALIEPLLKEQSTELRRFVVASLESFASRVVTETREYLASAPLPEPPARPAKAGRGWPVAALLASLLAVASLALVVLENRELATQNERLALSERQIAALKEAREASAAAAESAPEALASAPPPAERAGAPRLAALPVAYGEVPLSGARLEALRVLAGDLEKRGQAGTVQVTAHSADFCLTGNPGEGYSLAPEEMPANRCDVAGNPYDDALGPAQHESRAFADFVGTLAKQGTLSIQLSFAGRARPAVAYPPAAEATAAQWNAAASQNQRVELSFVPRLGAP